MIFFKDPQRGKLDGFFADCRKPLNSAGRNDFQGPQMEQLMHFAVRSFQLKFWFGAMICLFCTADFES